MTRHPLRSRVTARLLTASLLGSCLMPAAARAQQTPASLTGFEPARVEAELACEALLQELPRPEQFREHLRTITAEPHPTGSARQLWVADYLDRVMREAGLESSQHPYDVYLPQLSDDVLLEIVTPEPLRLSTQEEVLAEDRFSGNPDLLGGWNGFSGSGDVTGEVVYANYGRKEDFDKLVELGVSVRGRIVLTRYGGNFRGYKVKFAEAHGAAGVVIFNDPSAPGVDEYPAGPMMSPSTIQRGSVLTLEWTGDPLTPFEPALPLDSGVKVERLDPETVGLHHIPVLPIGYGAATEILSRMSGDASPEDWQGALPLTYPLVGGPELTLRVRVEQPKSLTRAVNVVGILRGSEFPDQWVMYGAHFDPWGFGAIDPNGGTAMLLTMAEALGELAERGCRPRRSIVIAHWDAEEYGIIGSVEWVEQFRDQLAASAVAYINADSAVSGPNFGASSSPSLKRPIIEATRAVRYPGSEQSVYEWWAERGQDGDPRLGNIGGGGSDHVGFYSHVGVPSGSLGFGAERSGVYHSNYDNFAWYERFGDVDFVFGPALTKINGIIALRLANADVLPYDVERYATDLAEHSATIRGLAEEHGIDVDLSRLAAATASLQAAAGRYVAARDGALLGVTTPAIEIRAVNEMLVALERAFVYEEGLQGRPWYRSLYASPDPFSGYASWMLPGLRYEVETESREGLRFWEGVYAQTVDELTRRVEALADALQN